MTDRELMQQALEALEEGLTSKQWRKLIAALRKRLAQLEQEPCVKTIRTWQQRCEEHPDHNGIVTDGMIQARMQEEIDELRAAIEQAHQKPLTEKRIEELYSFWVVDCQDIVGFARAVERSKPKMQPCAGRNCGSINPNLHSAECFEDYEKSTGMNQRKPLPPQSPCEMTQAERKMFRLGWLECEAAHGIKGEA